MDPLTYLRALRQWWWLPVGCVLLAASVAWLTAPEPEEVEERVERNTVFEATHTLVREDGEDGEDRGAGKSMPMSFDLLQFMIEVGEFPERLADRLDYEGDPLELIDQFTVAPDNELGTFQISATRDDPEEAEEQADAFAEEVLEFLVDVGEERHQDELEEARTRRGRIETRLDELDGAIAARGGSGSGHPEVPRLLDRREALVNQLISAETRVDELELQGQVEPGLVTLRSATAQPRSREGGTPLQPPENRSERIGAASGVGLIIGLALVLVVDRLDTRVRTRRAAEEAFGLPVIAEIPKLRWPDNRQAARITQTRPQSDAAEAFRMARLALQLTTRYPTSAGNGNGRQRLPVADHGRGEQPRNLPGQAATAGGHQPATSVPLPASSDTRAGQVVVVTSPSGHDGKTTLVANLAQTFAEMGQQVLCVDCDLRNPRLHTTFGLADGTGITDALANRDTADHPGRLAVETGLEGVWLLRAGTGAQQPWLAPRPDQDTLAQLRRLADVILLDSGPSLSVNDPSVLMPAADAVVVVARAGRITVEGAYRTRELLHRVGAPALGLVFNAVSARNRSLPHRSSSSGRTPGGDSPLQRLLRWWLQPADQNGGSRAVNERPHDPERHANEHSGTEPADRPLTEQPPR